MKLTSVILSSIFFLLTGIPTLHAQQSMDVLIDRELPWLLKTYKGLHAAPELSRKEEKTADLLARELSSLGFEVTRSVGQYLEPGDQCFGVVAVMRNGTGPTVLVRTDMDALPVEEQTGLPYASKVRVINGRGQEVPVMHACGHDIHMTVLLGTAKALSGLKAQWRGTLVMIGQPAEETAEGARAMLSDGLYTRFPKPDFALALHDHGDIETGKVALSPEYITASATSVDIIVRGVGGHGARPDQTKDPVVTAAQIVLGLQTIVSRELPPVEPAVVTVGSIQGGRSTISFRTKCACRSRCGPLKKRSAGRSLRPSRESPGGLHRRRGSRTALRPW